MYTLMSVNTFSPCFILRGSKWSKPRLLISCGMGYLYHKRALEPYLKWIIMLLWNASQDQIRIWGSLRCFHIHTYLLLRSIWRSWYYRDIHNVLTLPIPPEEQQEAFCKSTTLPSNKTRYLKLKTCHSSPFEYQFINKFKILNLDPV